MSRKPNPEADAKVATAHPSEKKTQLKALGGSISRSCAVLVEALNRHRGKGQQKVTVEHVTVNAGGQAIVGSVQARGGPN
jgi:hypothetical protein